jgi:hypothetical protein
VEIATALRNVGSDESLIEVIGYLTQALEYFMKEN